MKKATFILFVPILLICLSGVIFLGSTVITSETGTTAKELSVFRADSATISETATYRSANFSQPGVEVYVDGTFGPDSKCVNACGGIAMLPEGWSVVNQVVSIKRSVFQGEYAVYQCHVKSRAGMPQSYTATVGLDKLGAAFLW